MIVDIKVQQTIEYLYDKGDTATVSIIVDLVNEIRRLEEDSIYAFEQALKRDPDEAYRMVGRLSTETHNKLDVMLYAEGAESEHRAKGR